MENPLNKRILLILSEAMMAKNFCILLTASIRQQNEKQGARSSITDREHDYLTALQYYTSLDLPIVFCDNSDLPSEPISRFCREHSGQIEYLSFHSLQSHLGKAHGEKEILDKVHLVSEKIKLADYVIKVTGRLKVKNLSAIIRKLNEKEFSVSANIGKNLTWADSRFFIYRKNFYLAYLEPALRQHLNEPGRIYFEHCLAKAIHRLLSESEGFLLLPCFPEYIGRNGTTNKKYDLNLFERILFSSYYKLKRFVYNKIH